MALPIVLIALTVHEFSHGYMAYRLGDPTARNLGRLTLNPLKHLDLIGTVCMVLFHFGWAKPVPINSRYFRKPRRDMALTALAGPVANLLMALTGVLLYRIFMTVLMNIPVAGEFAYNLVMATVSFIYTFIYYNTFLAVFNLIPVPPFDGSRIFLTFLPPKYYFGVMKYEKYVHLVLLILLMTGVLSGPLRWIVNHVINGMQFLVGLLPFLV